MPNHELVISKVTPQALPDELWQPLWEIHQAAYAETLTKRTPGESAFFIGSVAIFKHRALHPAGLPGQSGFNPNQTYKRAVLLIAYNGHEPVGFANTADNVSGASEHDRRVKELIRWKNYRTIINEVVQPDKQGWGIGLALAIAGLRTAQFGQRGTAYTFPEELPGGAALLRRLGAEPAGEPQTKQYFGPDAEPAIQQRYLITTARGAARRAAKG